MNSSLIIAHKQLLYISIIFTVLYFIRVSLISGKDASLAFITGDFTEGGLSDDVSSLSPLQMMALYDWLAFYQSDYQSVGM